MHVLHVTSQHSSNVEQGPKISKGTQKPAYRPAGTTKSPGWRTRRGKEGRRGRAGDTATLETPQGKGEAR